MLFIIIKTWFLKKLCSLHIHTSLFSDTRHHLPDEGSPAGLVLAYAKR